MKVISIIKKHTVVIIGVLAIATLSLISLSSAQYAAQSKNTNNTHQTLTSTSVPGGITNTYHPSSAPHTLVTSVSDQTSSSLTENSTSSDSTQSLSVTTGDSNPITPAPIPITTPPVTIIPSCQPCGIYRPESVKTDALVCPMVNCPIIYPTPPVNPPAQPIIGCIPCGTNNQLGESNPHMCAMIACEY